MTIGERIKTLRKRNDVTQEKLADYLHISCQAVSKWENNTALPDITLVVPLANFFGVTTDEIFGVARDTAALDDAEFDRRMKEYANLGELRSEIELCREMVEKYPRNFKYLERLASVLNITSCSHGFTEDEKSANVDEAIEICRLIMEDCTDDRIRTSTRQTLVFAYSQKGDCERAYKIACEASSIHVSRESLIDSLPLSTDEIKESVDSNILTYADNLAQSIAVRAAKLGDDNLRLAAYEAARSIWATVIDDGNYLFYHDRLMHLHLWSAYIYGKRSDRDNAVRHLKSAYRHAVEADVAESVETNYTGRFVSNAKNYTSVSKNYTWTHVECVRREFEYKVYDFVRDDGELSEISCKNG